jgi:DNA (cytosine-5)-methyltransferase 1
MNHGSLFSGIGGFDLAAQWMGWNNVFHCEWNEFGKKVLNYYWPNAISYDDITNTDFSIHRETIDILTGGFPCQPYSQAGKRLGKEDDRHLWPEMLRAIREIQPRYIVGENVFGIVNWNGGLVFEEVQTNLEAEGYEIQPVVLPACAINAPHRRDRVWFVAYRNGTGLQKERPEQQTAGVEQYGELDVPTPNSNISTKGSSRTSGEAERNGSGNDDESESRRQQTEQYFGCSNVLRADANSNDARTRKSLQSERTRDESSKKQPEGKPRLKSWTNGSHEPTSHAPNPRVESLQREGKDRVYGFATPPYPGNERLQGSEEQGSLRESGKERKASWAYDDGRWPTQSPICSGNDGFPEQLDGITFPKWRNESIKAYGNAIVPQVAFEIFKVINEMSK